MPMMTIREASIPPSMTPTKISNGEVAYLTVANKDIGNIATAATNARS
jgi:hypothetical protein